MRILYGFFVLLLECALSVSVQGQTAVFNVRDYNALGDGQTKDTVALQQAIDSCSGNGGGTVVVPPGTYVTGSLFLKSNVDFYLMEGAVLLGSPDKEDYNRADVCPQNETSANESSFGAHLILCIEQQNVTLRGPGRIDGNRDRFLVDENGVPYPGQDKIPWRPSQMIYFVESDNIRVQDIELTDSTYWTSLFHGCTHVFIRGVQIKNSRFPHTHNGDGIDIDCCEYVTISDCQIDSADDCITLRGHVAPLKTPRPCRYVTVSNCVLSTPCNCFRFGVGDGEVNNINISNIVIETSRTAFNFVSCWQEGGRGVDISNIRISNICVDCEVLIHMYYQYATETVIRNIDIDGVSGVLRQVSDMDIARRDESCVWLNAKTPYMVLMEGKPDRFLHEIRLANINLDVFEDASFISRYVENFMLENVILNSVNPEKPVRYQFENVREIWKNGRLFPDVPAETTVDR